MIRTKTKIFGEVNASNTCTTPNFMSIERLIVTNNNGELSVLWPIDKNGNITSGIYYVDANGKAAFFPTNGANKLLSTDSSGNLTWVNI